ncbi:hypothetical protein [Steroidobacter cummioxidans]|uniref:hypothetical protein n=1 Tax=Steroidobacter cummioxidans TaxID=1803913 RepID=UPI000E317853|nr:hypothetical protein [Steroidobacter cummioxidans]
MKIRKQILAGAVASSMIGLAACGGGSTGSQDVGTNPSGNSGPNSSRTFHARAIDGYLAGATVFVDQNLNGKLDAFEPRALTDNHGYFSYNHRTNTDYCAEGGLNQYCLRGAIAADTEVVLRVTGGYDTVTSLPFKGMLSLRSSDLKRDDLRLVTPLTSTVADSSSNVQAKLDALIAAGVLQPGGTLKDDLLAGGNAEQMSRAQLLAIISRMTGEVGNLTQPPATFADVEGPTWAAGYIEAAKKLALIDGVGTFEPAFTSVGSLEDIARRAIFAATNAGLVMPADFQLPNYAAYQPILQNTADIIAVNKLVIDSLPPVPTPEELKAVLRLQMVAAERGFNNPADSQLDNMADWVRNQLAQGNGLGSDFTALGGDNIDLSALIAPGFNFDPSSNSISASATIPAGAATAFASLVNTAFSVNLDKPHERGDAVFFISGANGARDGDIKVCVRYRGDDGDFDTTSSADPNGALLVSGRWSLLDDHTLTLGINVAGGVRSMLLKAVGTNPSGLDYRFDFGKDLSSWSGSAPAGFAAGSVPANDTACKAALIERFGQMTT